MKRIIIFLFTICISIFFSCLKGQIDEYAMVTFVIGEVTKNSAMVQIGDIIKEKDVLKTGSDSFCDIKIGSSILRIKEKSSLTISNLIKKGDTENTLLGLDIGKMLCKPKKLMKSESFIVKTPTAVAGVRGTKFTVEADIAKTTRIKVFEGNVKVVKRVKQLDQSVNKILDVAPVISKEEKVIVTEKDVLKAEKIVDKILKEETAKKEEEAIAVVIKKARNDVIISEKDIKKFAISDFEKENKEIIEIKEKPKEIIQKIAKIIKLEKEMPKPEGRLLITRYEIYFIKGGNIIWEGKVINEPIHKGDKLYIASGNYIFCVSSDGPVLWRRNQENDGKLEIKENKLIVFSKGRENSFDLETGQEL